MIVEFTGCSGSGKTSLARRVHRLLRAERCADAPISRCLPATTFSHLSTELLGWPWLLVARRRHSVCDGLVRRSIREVSLSRGECLRLSRSWNRKLAMMGGYRTSVIGSAVSLQDEGPIHFAMTLFARWPFGTTEALNRYLDHVPLPDRVVCVRASHERWRFVSPNEPPDRYRIVTSRLAVSFFSKPVPCSTLPVTTRASRRVWC